MNIKGNTHHVEIRLSDLAKVFGTDDFIQIPKSFARSWMGLFNKHGVAINLAGPKEDAVLTISDEPAPTPLETRNPKATKNGNGKKAKVELAVS